MKTIFEIPTWGPIGDNILNCDKGDTTPKNYPTMRWKNLNKYCESISKSGGPKSTWKPKYLSMVEEI